MNIALDKVCELILRAKALDVREANTDPNSGSNPTDDGSTDVLITGTDDLTEQEVRDFIAGLDDDERYDLVALTWLGRGDYDPEDFAEARRMALERDTGPTADYLLGIPNLGDLLDEGVTLMGGRCT